MLHGGVVNRGGAVVVGDAPAGQELTAHISQHTTPALYTSHAQPYGTRSTISGAIQNALTTKGVTIVTDRDALIHTSGHPRRDEMTELYAGYFERKVRPRA